jgi:Pan3 Pseudokinase domain
MPRCLSRWRSILEERRCGAVCDISPGLLQPPVCCLSILLKQAACTNVQVMLLSRDEMSMLVVSYAEIARCLRAAYGELQARCGAPR